MENAEDYLPEETNEVVYHVPDHEVVLSFNDDEHAYAFHDWWGLVGGQAFVKWVKTERHLEFRK